MKEQIKILAIIFSFFFISITNAQTDTIKLKPVDIQDSTFFRQTFVMNQINSIELLKSTNRDLGEYLRKVPNVSGIRKGGSAVDPVMRGFKFSQINTILDNGIRIENGCPNRMDPVSSHVETEDIENIKIVKGPYALQYGPAMGGVINLITKKAEPFEKFEIHGTASYGYESNWNGNKTYLSVFGGNKKVFFLLSGGYRDYGNYTSGKMNDTSIVYQSSFTKFNYKASLGFAISQKQKLVFTYNGVHGRDVFFPALPMDELSDDTRIISVDYSWEPMQKSFKKIEIKLYQSDVLHIMDNNNRATKTVITPTQTTTKLMTSTVDAVNTGARAEASFDLNNNAFVVGMDYENIYKDGDREMKMSMTMPGIPTTTSFKYTNLWFDAMSNNIGLFSNYKREYKSWLYTASLRFDLNMANSSDTFKLIKNNINYYDNLESQYLNVSGSVGVSKYFNKNNSLSIAVGRGMRSPNMLERFIKLMPTGYDNFDYLGNPQLKPEINNQIDLTYNFTNSKYGALYLNTFYALIQDFIGSNRLAPTVITPQTLGVLGVKQFENIDLVKVYGFEFGFTSPEKYKLGVAASGGLTYGTVASIEKYVLTGSTVTGDTLLTNDALSEIPPFEATVNVHYKFFNGNLVPSISARFVADQNHTSMAFYENKTPGFALLNCAVSYKFLKYFEVQASVSNVFDRAYYEHLNRKIIGTKANYYEAGRVFAIQLKATF